VRVDPARRVAEELERRGLGAPARLLIEAHLPLAPLLSDAGAALGPLLGAVGGRRAGQLRQLLDDGTAIERLVAELDDLEARHADSG
jgi:hypothetical protein